MARGQSGTIRKDKQMTNETTPMTCDAALAALKSAGDADRATQLAKLPNAGEVFGVPAAQMEEFARAWRQDIDLEARLELARELWETDVLEARLMAAKLLTQARIKDDAAIWEQIIIWLDQAGNWTIVDVLCAAGSRRLMADISRIETVEKLAYTDTVLARRASLLLTEKLAKSPHPSEAEQAALDRACEWLPAFLEDDKKDVHRTAQSWVRSLAKHHFKRAKTIRTARN